MSGLSEALGASVRIGTPLLFAGLGELVLERAGMINIGIEGVMLCGAYAGFHVAWAAGSPALGAFAGALAGAGFMLIFAGMVLRVRADQIVTGMALNLMATGITGTAYALLREKNASSLDAPRMQAVAGALRDIPVLGPALFSQSALTWTALGLVPAVWLYFNRTERGLELRACGDNPDAAQGAGVPVRLARMKACLASGALAGLGGAFLSVSQTGSFAANCTGGRGFIALSAVVLGQYGVLGTSAACLLFGAAFFARDAIPSSVAASELVEMLPYVLTLGALFWKFSRRAAPGGLGKRW